MKFKILFSIVLIATLGFGQKGNLSGIITDKENKNTPLQFANVLVKEGSLTTTTNEKGAYSISLAPGTFKIVYSFVGYENVEKTITISAGETTKIDVSLGSGGYTLKDVVIKSTTSREKETAILLDQKNAIEIKQSIGAIEMSRKGVANVEQGVSKLSGVSKVADRGIFIRGLDDRYNYLQINGLNFIPSDPNLKTIPLNFIPTDIVRNIDVYKTFKASLYQDFAGASINVVTKDVFNKPYTKVSISASGNSLSTFKDFKSNNDGRSDFYGYTNNNRNLPAVFGKNQLLLYQATPQESKEMFNASWTPEIDKAPLTIGTSITNSDSFNLAGDKKIGYLVNFNFSNNFTTQTGQRRNLNTNGTAVKDFTTSKWNYLTQKSALATLNFKKSSKYNFALNLIYIQNSENTIEENSGENTDLITIDKPFFLRDTKYTENTSIGFQQIGNIALNGKKLVLDYGLATTIGKNNMPDRKILITEGVGPNSNYVTFGGADPFRFYSKLDNFNVNGKIELEYNFGKELDKKFANSIKVGYNVDATDYKFFNRTIRSKGNGLNSSNTILDTNDPESFFNESFDNSLLSYLSGFDPTTNVDIKQYINAGFVNYTRNFERLTLDFGTRFEYLLRETKYNEEGDRVDDARRKIKYNPFDFSPVLNIKYLLNDKTNIRFTASRTSTKPRVREILPFRYSDGDGNFTIGNPQLKNTTNYNADLKYEIFPTKSSVLALAVFGKLIQNPISRLLEGTSTGFLTKFENFDEAKLYGLEIETNFGLDLILGETNFTKKVSFGLNTILMKSNESGNPLKFPRLTSTSRSLQGASDFIINADLNYEIAKTDKVESKIAVIFNTFSDRIYAIGTDGASDIIQKPINQIDLTWRNTFSKKYQLNLTMKNLLDAEFLATQNPTDVISNPSRFSNVNNRLTQGINVGLEFSYTFN